MPYWLFWNKTTWEIGRAGTAVLCLSSDPIKAGSKSPWEVPSPLLKVWEQPYHKRYKIQSQKVCINKVPPLLISTFTCITFTNLLPKPKLCLGSLLMNTETCLDSFLMSTNFLCPIISKKFIVLFSKKYKKIPSLTFLWATTYLLLLTVLFKKSHRPVYRKSWIYPSLLKLIQLFIILC